MASSSSGNTFRARRLSVSNLDTSEFDKAKDASPSSRGRGRRLSMSPEMGQKVLEPFLFQPEICGTFSCHGVEPGPRQGATTAKINQDRGATSFPLEHLYQNIKCTEAVFAVYDGHGANGDKVSHFVAQTVLDELAKNTKLLDSTDPKGVEEALQRAFESTDKLLKDNKSIDAQLSGTTAVAMLIRQYVGSDELHTWTAWAGDSRAVLWEAAADAKTCSAGDVTDLSHDHKPDKPEEEQRITKSKGFVSPPEEEWGGPARVWTDANFTMPGLAMSRSIGDHLVKDFGVIATPEVTHRILNMKDGKRRYVLLASDGVWEFIQSFPAMQLIAKFISEGATVAVTRVIETAAAKWRAEEGDYRDDITAICVSLHELINSKEWLQADT